MVRHLWSILCRDHSLDEKTNNISLFNVIEEIGMLKKQVDQIKLIMTNKDDLIVLPFGFTLVTLLKREGDIGCDFDGKIKIVLKDQQSKVMLEHEKVVKFVADKKRLRLLTTLMDIKLKEEGEYTFFILFKGGDSSFQEIGSLPLEVKFLDSY